MENWVVVLRLDVLVVGWTVWAEARCMAKMETHIARVARGQLKKIMASTVIQTIKSDHGRVRLVAHPRDEEAWGLREMVDGK